MKLWMWILIIAALVLGVLFLLSRRSTSTGPTTVTGTAPVSPAGTVASAFTNLVGAAAGVAADWVISKAPTINAPAPVAGAGSAPKLSQPANTSNIVYSV